MSNEPTREAERVVALDIIRGFALFGILMVNLQVWFRSTPDRYDLEPNPWPGLANAVTDVIVAVFFDGKFVSIFSMLFGVGLAIQMERAEARGARFGWFAFRRLGSLFLIGVAHIALIWWGDILHIYAVSGALLLLFLRRKTKTIVVWASILLALPTVIFSTLSIVFAVLHKPPPPPPDPALLREAVETAVRINRDGSWIEITHLRIADYLGHLTGRANTAPIAFMGFLVGLAAWKSGIVRRPLEHLPALKRILAIGLAFGITAAALRVYIDKLPRDQVLLPRRIILSFYPSSTMALAMAYGAGILLLLQKESWRSRLAALGYAGRMALTNYLLQSIICSFLFFGFGFGLYDRVGPAAAVPIVVSIYVFQLALSRLWLRRYRFGPVEWLWRSMTYGELMQNKAFISSRSSASSS